MRVRARVGWLHANQMSSSRGRTAVAPFSSCSKAEWLSTTTSATTSTTTTSVPPCQSIIVNADDLGYSVWTDNGIFRAFQDGLVSSASLLVNGASAASAANRARAQDMCLGLHLNLTEGRPLSPFDSIPQLLSPDGKLLYKEAFWTAAAAACKEETSSKSKFFDQVVLETRAQLAHFHELTGTPARHVDGHQHIHIAPGVASVLAPLFKSEGILSTRIPDENIAALTWVEPTKRIRWTGRIAVPYVL